MWPSFTHHYPTVGAPSEPQNEDAIVFRTTPSILIAIVAGIIAIIFFVRAAQGKIKSAKYRHSKAPAKINVNMQDLKTLIMEEITATTGASRYGRMFAMPGGGRQKPKLPKAIKELLAIIKKKPAILRKLGRSKEFREIWTAAGFVKGTPEYGARAMGTPYGSDEWYKTVSQIRSEDIEKKTVQDAVEKYEKAKAEKKENK